MKRYLYLILLVVPALSLPVQAGPFFNKKARPSPDKRVPELLYVVKADPDEGKRASAASELRDYDAKSFPEIVPVLIDVLQNDTKPSVRREAASSLGRVRPLSQAAGQALQAASKDPSMRVRIQAWSAYKMYQISGFTSRPKESKPAPSQLPRVTTRPSNPPVGTDVGRSGNNLVPGTTVFRPDTKSLQGTPVGRPSTSEPPLGDSQDRIIIIEPKAGTTGTPMFQAPPPSQSSVFSRPLPQGQPQPRTAPNSPRRSPPVVVDDGPMLEPQN